MTQGGNRSKQRRGKQGSQRAAQKGQAPSDGAQAETVESQASPSNDDNSYDMQCRALHKYYASLDRAEWWWLMDPSLEVIGAQLKTRGFAVLDNFLDNEQAASLKSEVKKAHDAGRLSPAGLVNGKVKDLEEAKYADTKTRGDVIGWFDNTEEGWPYGKELDRYLLKLGTLQSELSNTVPELQKVTSRSKCMVACYPGGGARYVKHVDNDGRHPLCKKRILTALIYLNEGWRAGDGGELAIYEASNQDIERKVVEPLFNRVLIFWSDYRTPHEVRPAQITRYAVTLWFLGHVEDNPPISPDAVIAQPSATGQPGQSKDNRKAATEKSAVDNSAAETVAAEELAAKKAAAQKAAAIWASAEKADAEKAAAASAASEKAAAVKAAPEKAAAKKDAAGQASVDEALPGKGVQAAITTQDAAATSLIASQERAGVRYAWLQRDGAEPAGSWELQVELLDSEATPECPALDISEFQVRIASAAGEQLLSLPLAVFGNDASVSAVPKWSKKRRRLTVEFPAPAAPLAVPAADRAVSLAAQLRKQGWGYLDGFLPGPEADALRQLVLAEHRAGRLRAGGNSHEGPVGTAMKNDEYTFVEAGDSASSPLTSCARRCNKLLAGLLKDGSVSEIRGVPLMQGRPMLAVYPGNGAKYGKHYDATESGKGKNGRELTVLVYLNPFWTEADGGCLRLLENLEDTAGVDVEPLHGRLVAFLCRNRCPHEVLPAWNERAAVTFWYYDSKRLAERCKPGEDIGGFSFESA